MAKRKSMFDRLVDSIESDTASTRRCLVQVLADNQTRLREVTNPSPRETARWTRSVTEAQTRLAALDRGERVSIIGL